MTERQELLDASDAVIEDAVVYADPMVLRGLLYQLTGDEEITRTKVTHQVAGFLEVPTLADPGDVALLQAKAARFLKDYRDRGAGELGIESERLHRSISLAAGADIPDHDMGLWTEQLALSPWARSMEWPAEPSPAQLEDFSVAVIGAGMGGLNASVQLKHAGIRHTVIEKNAEVGGTWYENRYPGARVDTPSRGYTHVYGVDFSYPNPFCPQSENERYFNWIADTFEIRDNIEFNTEVKTIVWDEQAGLWEVQAVGPDGPRTWRVNAVMSAVGFLSRPNVPDFEGLDQFQGEVFHTARWPRDAEVEGKRVAVVGSGCTSYQLIPELVKSIEHLSIFQRTPNWCYDIPGYLEPFPSQVNWLDRNLPYHTNYMRFRAGYLFGPDVVGRAFDADPVRNERIRQQRLEFMRSKFADRPDLMEKMLPEAPPMSARPVLVDEAYSIYDVLLQDNVDLVADPIARFTPEGIVTEDGAEYPIDIVVLATGFKANDFLWPMDIRGEGGVSIEKLWAKDGARAYIGSMMPGFPNFFMIYGPNTNPLGGLGVADFEELETRFALDCMAHLILNGKKSIEVTSDAYWRYNDELDRAEHTKIYSDDRVTNYYKNDYGRSAANCPFPGQRIWAWLRDPAERFTDSGAREIIKDSSVRPYIGQDLTVR
jgi:4-hydroxyacetophenone monooxygenase